MQMNKQKKLLEVQFIWWLNRGNIWKIFWIENKSCQNLISIGYFFCQSQLRSSSLQNSCKGSTLNIEQACHQSGGDKLGSDKLGVIKPDEDKPGGDNPGAGKLGGDTPSGTN